MLVRDLFYFSSYLRGSTAGLNSDSGIGIKIVTGELSGASLFGIDYERGVWCARWRFGKHQRLTLVRCRLFN